MKGASPLACAIQAWMLEPEQRLGAAWQKPFINGLAQLLTTATVDDCVYAGFEFDPVRQPLRGKVVDHGCLATIEFSAETEAAQHRAVCIGWMDDDSTRVWVDGVALAVPTYDDGWPQANPYATGWCADRYYFIEIGGLFSHPLSDPTEERRLGNVHGLLIWDAERRAMRLESPQESQLWTSPCLTVEAGALYIYATRDAVGQSAPARLVPLDEAFPTRDG